MTPRSKIATTLVMSVAVVGALGVRPSASVFAEEATRTGSAKLFQPLKKAHEDLNAKKYADAITKLKAAEAIAGKTPYDQHLINDMLGFAYIRTDNFAEAAKALAAELNDGFTPANDVPTRVRALAQLNYQIKNYDKAIGYGTRAIQGGFADEEITTLVGQAYYLKADWKGTVGFEDELVSGEIKRGETPKKTSLQLLNAACVKLQDKQCTTRALEWLNRYYSGSGLAELRAPSTAPVGTLFAFYFGASKDLEHPKRPAKSQDDNKDTK